MRLVETQVRVLRAETARQDSARAAELARIIQLQQRLLDSLTAGRQALRTLEAKVGGDLTEVQRQLLAVQELTGQSQKRLSELKAQLDARAEATDARPQPAAPVATAQDSAAATAAPPAPAPAVSADQMYQSALQQLRRGSLGTARKGFQEFLQAYPSHPLLPDALYHLGETFAVEAPDSALVYYGMVLTRFPQSPRASAALYKTGLIAERRGDPRSARATYQRLMTQYPRSEEAAVARDRLATLKP